MSGPWTGPDGSGGQIVITKLEYDPGDKRSCGSLEVEATTSKGKLKIHGYIQTGGDIEYSEENHGVFLDGKILDVWTFDPGLPHYYAGSRALSRAQENLDVWMMEALADTVACL